MAKKASQSAGGGRTAAPKTKKARSSTKKSRAATAARTGRPPKPVDEIELEKLAAIHVTVRQAAAWFDMAESTFRDKLARNERLRGIWQHGKEKGRVALRQTLYRLAESSAGAAIFLAKNELGMIDEKMLKHRGDADEPIRHTLGYDLGKLPTPKLKALRTILAEAEVEIEKPKSDEDDLDR